MAKTPWSFGFLSAIGLNNEYLYKFIHVNVCVHVCLYVKYTLLVFDWTGMTKSIHTLFNE